MTEKLTDLTFEEMTRVGNWIVDCWAVWCGPCKLLEPIMEELSTELNGKVRVGKLNVDENRMTASKFGIMSIPTTLFFQNGVLVDKLVGALPKEKIRERLNEVFEI